MIHSSVSQRFVRFTPAIRPNCYVKCRGGIFFGNSEVASGDLQPLAVRAIPIVAHDCPDAKDCRASRTFCMIK